MIEDLVNTFSAIIQLLILVVIVVGGYFGYTMIPDSFQIGSKVIEPIPLFKILFGSIGAGLASAIFFGPALVLIDMRDAIRSIDRKTSLTVLTEMKDGIRSIDRKTTST